MSGIASWRLLAIVVGWAAALAAVGCDDAGRDAGAGGDADADADDDESVDADRDADPEPDADGDLPSDAETRPGDELPFDEIHLAATHNSYSGGDRRSVTGQLEGGVRVVELDVHDDDFASAGYRVGHDDPGDQVDRIVGNPSGDGLRDWLEVLTAWTASAPDHAPVVLYIDLKDSLADNRSWAEGDLARLNDLLVEVLGDRLYPAEALGAAGWPRIGELRGRILCVLSGHEGSRLAYRRDQGETPAVAIDGRGRVIEVHDSGSGELWYWTGEIGPGAGAVTWHRHGRYDTGQGPAVALNDDGVVVEVHEDPDTWDDQLWYRTGILGADFEITWSSPAGLPFPGDDSGVAPTVRFLDLGGTALREVHRSPETDLGWYWDGAYDPGEQVVRWTRGADGGRTDEPPPRVDVATAGGETVEVAVGADGPFDADTLLARVGGGDLRRIRFRQLAFVEAQHGGSDALAADGVLFFAGAAGDDAVRSWAAARRREGRLVRLWQFDDAGDDADPPVSFAATDFPFTDWYRAYCAALHCAE